MPIPKLSNVSSDRGAPMGRGDTPPETDNQRFYLQRIKPVDGDYDEGGAYWGFGWGTNPLWRWVTEDHTGEGFVRAVSRDQAQQHIREDYPNARFFR